MALDRATVYRLDVFCVGSSTIDRAQLERAVPIPLPDGVTLLLASVEGTVLARLQWYAITLADKQWYDMQTILRVQGEISTALTSTAGPAISASPRSGPLRGVSPPHHRGAWAPDDSQQTRMDI